MLFGETVTVYAENRKKMHLVTPFPISHQRNGGEAFPSTLRLVTAASST
jgi:hypothetical protein